MLERLDQLSAGADQDELVHSPGQPLVENLVAPSFILRRADPVTPEESVMHARATSLRTRFPRLGCDRDRPYCRADPCAAPTAEWRRNQESLSSSEVVMSIARFSER